MIFSFAETLFLTILFNFVKIKLILSEDNLFFLVYLTTKKNIIINKNQITTTK
jgi:hypothetical protein